MASIIALITGISFFYASRRYRNRTYYVRPVKSVVVSRAQLSDLRVFYRDQQVEDVTAAEIAIWNQGNEPIRMENLLDEVRIVTRPARPILKVTVIKVSRSVIGLDYDQRRLAMGIVPLSWRILEQGDGALVQLIYAGTADTAVGLAGTVEGQNGVTEIKFGGRILSATEQIKEQKRAFLGIVVALTAGGGFLTSFLVLALAKSEELRKQRRTLVPVAVAIFLILCAMTLYVYFRIWIQTPPFGF